MSGTLSLDEDGTIPVLDGWMTLPKAGEVLGITRQSAYKMAKKKKFKTLHLVEGTSIVLVRTEEVEALAKSRLEITRKSSCLGLTHVPPSM